MPTVLDDIVAGVREDLADAQAVVPRPASRSSAAEAAPRSTPRRRCAVPAWRSSPR